MHPLTAALTATGTAIWSPSTTADDSLHACKTMMFNPIG
jgi:hypothetical protein